MSSGAGPAALLGDSQGLSLEAHLHLLQVRYAGQAATMQPEVLLAHQLAQKTAGCVELGAMLPWLLLRQAFDQGAPACWIDQLLARLAVRFGDALWHLPAPRQADLQTELAAMEGWNRWCLCERYVGITLSVGDFVRRRAPFNSWLRGGLHLCLEQVAQEILHFGKWSKERPKGRLFLTLLHSSFRQGKEDLEGKSRLPHTGEVCWDNWVFPLLEAHMQFWHSHRQELTREARVTRMQVALKLSACYRDFCKSDPLGPWLWLRQERG